MLPAIILAVASLSAGHPVTVSCDADTNRPVNAPKEGLVLGWSYTPSNEVHLSKLVCDKLEYPPDPEPLVDVFYVTWSVAFATLIHESKHAGGTADEACANLYTLLTASDYLRRMGVSRFNHYMHYMILSNIVTLIRTQAAPYQFELC